MTIYFADIAATALGVGNNDNNSTNNNNIFIDAAVGTIGFQFVGFVAATILRTEVFYDCFGGLNFLGVALLATYYNNNGTFESDNNITTTSTTPLFMLFTALFVISRGWLLVFLVWRAHKRKGDSRFDEVISNPPLFFVYWMVQACWVYLTSMPLLVLTAAASSSPTDGMMTLTDWTLLIGFAGSIVLEITSDIQKTVWVEQGRKGTFCQVGWWKYSRHPNYAGEVFQWWFAAIIAVVSGHGGPSSSSSSSSTIGLVGYYKQLPAFISPIFTMHILLNLTGTGIWNAEGMNQKRYYESNNRDDYIQYREKTSPLILFPPSWYKNIPMAVKRLFFLEWERYEYNDTEPVDIDQKKVS